MTTAIDNTGTKFRVDKTDMVYARLIPPDQIEPGSHSHQFDGPCPVCVGLLVARYTTDGKPIKRY